MTTAEKHIRHFNLMNGNEVRKETLQRFLNKLPADAALNELKAKLKKALARFGNAKYVELRFTPLKYVPVVKKPEAKSVKQKADAPVKKVVPVKKSVAKKNLSGPAFYEIPLDGEWKNEFHRLMSDTQIMSWGSPGSGKSTKLLRFANYLADKGLKVLYVAREEYGRSTFDEKLRSQNIGHANKDGTYTIHNKNLNIQKHLPGDLSSYGAVFLDSVNALRMSLEDYIDIVEKYPNRIYYPIVQSTKAGDFKGGKEWEHEVDIAGEIVNRRLILTKNRLDSDFAQKAELLTIDETVNRLTKRKQIDQAVKMKLTPEAPSTNVIMI
jgi:hypothetical protein